MEKNSIISHPHTQLAEFDAMRSPATAEQYDCVRVMYCEV